MKEFSFIGRIRNFIGLIAWRVFLWAIDSTEEEYWKQVVELEEMRKAESLISHSQEE